MSRIAVLAGPHRFANPIEWLRQHDPAYGALRRAVRAALVMPAIFALADKGIGSPVMGTFAAFGSFAMLLLVDFSGPVGVRILNQTALGLACALLICLGTLASRTTWVAAVSMAVVAFAVLFAGCVSSVLVSATTALLLAFILPVTLRASASAIPDRVAGWGLAAGASVLAIALLWPSPELYPVRGALIAACRAVAERLRADIAYMTSGGGPAAVEGHRAAIGRANEAVQAVLDVFFATPYRPTGLSTEARGAVRLVDELRWLNSIVLRSGPRHHPPRPDLHVCAVKEAGAAVLERSAALLESPHAGHEPLGEALAKMHSSLAELEQATVGLLPAVPSSDGRDEHSAQAVVSSLDPSFRAQELSFIVAQIAENADFSAAAAERSWIDRLLGRQPAGAGGPLRAAQERAGAHVTRQSLWLRNSVRGAAALALAVLVADLSSVQHGFWVAFGTLSVLRSNALSTGENIVRALLGTAVGFAIGGGLVYLIGTNTAMLWALLPIVILFAGLAPATISFAAGQAAFTATLLILFNLIVPAGWKLGLVRVEDVAIGGGVSLAVGLLMWPRGAAAALGRALGGAYTDTARYLVDAVAYGVGCCDPSGPPSPDPNHQALEAAAASRRLDDTFRGYLSERGSKSAPLADVAGLLTGVTGMRLAADAIVDLWSEEGVREGHRSAARRELTRAVAGMASWYDHFGASLTRAEAVPDPMARDEVADGRLVDAVASDLQASDGETTATGVRVIWTGDHLDAVRRVQDALVPRARAAVAVDSAGPEDGTGFRRLSRRPGSAEPLGLRDRRARRL